MISAWREKKIAQDGLARPSCAIFETSASSEESVG
jgi:hypothetical protein